jgi:hypothetical protein
MLDDVGADPQALALALANVYNGQAQARALASLAVTASLSAPARQPNAERSDRLCGHIPCNRIVNRAATGRPGRYRSVCDGGMGGAALQGRDGQEMDHAKFRPARYGCRLSGTPLA